MSTSSFNPLNQSSISLLPQLLQTATTGSSSFSTAIFKIQSIAPWRSLPFPCRNCRPIKALLAGRRNHQYPWRFPRCKLPFCKCKKKMQNNYGL